ncbi:MAG: GNAT family N-acetyltransferase [Xanthomonadales bacterium]|nr:GNAT family N-acetyltransferase [Xanthomonadales bacterium]
MTDLPDCHIRPICSDDDLAIARIIRRVMPEFGADGPGFAIHDLEVDHMSRAYADKGCVYFVVALAGQIVGGAGIAPLQGSSETICELRKMYFLPEARGRGIGAAMMEVCLQAASDMGYQRCYLETLTGMDAAQRLYERSGFQRLSAALGETGHFGCNRFYIRELPL